MRLFFLLILSVLSLSTQAALYHKSGQVQDILLRTHLDAHAIVYIDGFTEAGSCIVNGGVNRVILAISSSDKQDAMYSMALAAFMAGKTVKVAIDDSVVDADGYCLIRDLRLNPSF